MMNTDGSFQDWTQSVAETSEFVTLMDGDDRLLHVNHPQAGAEDYAGRSVYDYVEAEYHGVVRQAVADARATGFPQQFDSWAAGENGGRAHYSNWVIGLHGQGLENLVVFVATDISRQGRMQAELELSETTWRSLVENSPDSILIADRQRRIQFVNRVEFGFDDRAVLGEPAEMFVPPQDRQTVVDAFERVLATGEPQSYETGLDSPMGVLHFTTRVAPINGDDGISRVMLVATDITARVEAEREKQRLADELQQAQKMESLGQLTGGVAHDFNNILVTISGNLELAELADDHTERDERIADARAAVVRAATLTDRLLAFSRKKTLHPRRVDIGDLVAGMHDLLNHVLGETIEVTVERTGRLWPCQVDAGQLETAILNLAVNARDAMPDGGQLLIRSQNRSVADDADASVDPGDYVLLEFVDTGSGMSPDVAARVFEPFYTTKEVGRGSGLGLSMVYGFVRQSGGHIRVVSEPGHGTSVQLYFDTTRGADHEEAEPAAADEHSRGNGELILVVEDDEMVRSLTGRLLRRLGFRTVLAPDAGAAMTALAEEPTIAAMLTDVVLSGGTDGFGLADAARRERPNLPVVFVSGYSADVASRRGGRDVAAHLLTKPYTSDQLGDAIRRHLDAPPPTGP